MQGDMQFVPDRYEDDSKWISMVKTGRGELEKLMQGIDGKPELVPSSLPRSEAYQSPSLPASLIKIEVTSWHQRREPCM